MGVVKVEKWASMHVLRTQLRTTHPCSPPPSTRKQRRGLDGPLDVVGGEARGLPPLAPGHVEREPDCRVVGVEGSGGRAEGSSKKRWDGGCRGFEMVIDKGG